jgi:transcriptional regulator with XRE-family HTH domain
VFKNKNDTKNNICGEKISRLRNGLKPYVSQRALAEKMQLKGIDLDKNAIQRIECGNRFVTDIELRAFANIFGVSADFLISGDEPR